MQNKCRKSVSCVSSAGYEFQTAISMTKKKKKSHQQAIIKLVPCDLLNHLTGNVHSLLHRFFAPSKRYSFLFSVCIIQIMWFVRIQKPMVNCVWAVRIVVLSDYAAAQDIDCIYCRDKQQQQKTNNQYANISACGWPEPTNYGHHRKPINTHMRRSANGTAVCNIECGRSFSAYVDILPEDYEKKERERVWKIGCGGSLAGSFKDNWAAEFAYEILQCSMIIMSITLQYDAEILLH